jgi:hypothetical protein
VGPDEDLLVEVRDRHEVLSPADAESEKPTDEYNARTRRFVTD